MSKRGAPLVKRLLRTQARAKALYVKAEKILDELLQVLEPGAVIDLGDGRIARLVDQFADRNTCWRSSSFNRFKVEVEERV